MRHAELAARRLLAQQIARPRFANPADVVAWLGAVQAQDYLGALWAVGLRAPGATERDVERAIADRAIVRTWPMRGTIHFVAAADARWMLDLLAPRVVRRTSGRRSQLGLDEPTIAASAQIVARALEGGRQLTRPALYELLERAGIATRGSRGLHILGRLAHDQLICFGARDGKQPTFALLDEWVPPAPALPHDEALTRLALRYFTGHGPATAQDFVWWAGLTIKEARSGLADAAGRLGHARIGEQDYYFATDAPAGTSEAQGVFLLPPFDEFLVGYRDRGAMLDPDHQTHVVPGNNGMFNPIVVVDGRVEGIWKRALGRDTVAMSASPFASFDDAQLDAIAAAAERYGRFLGKRPLLDR